MNNINHYFNKKLDILMSGFIPILFCIHFTIIITVLVFPINYYWFFPYLVFIYFDNSPELGGRRLAWLNDNLMFRRTRKHFNINLIREKELDPNKNYLFNYHPHGIWGYGAQSVFRNSNPQYNQLFPGIDIRVLTLNANLSPPIHREVLMGMGFCSCSKKSMIHLLTKGPGSSCMLIPGGGAEALRTRDDSAELVLKTRLGFAKIAIETGASLVPVYGFGETSTYKIWTPNSPLYDKIQNICQLGGFRLPIYFGRGLIDNTVGIFPYKKQITVVVGEPIQIKKDTNPTKEDIQKVHSEYLKALKDLYDKYKNDYHTGPLPAPELKFV